MANRLKKKPAIEVDVLIPYEELQGAADAHFGVSKESTIDANVKPPVSKDYRKLALKHYKREVSGVQVNVCVMCGFGIASILEVAHLDQNRKNCAIDNLATLCPNCHKMHDIGLIPTEVITKMRDQTPKENWSLRIKDAGAKAATTRKLKSAKKKRSDAAHKAVATRKAKKLAPHT